MKLEELMTHKTCMVDPDTDLVTAAQLMLENDIGALPVVAEDGHPIGILTDRDIVCRSLGHDESPFGRKVKDYMSDRVIALPSQTELSEGLNVMEQYKIRRLVVVDEKGTICGMVSQADIARAAADWEKAELLERVSE